MQRVQRFLILSVALVAIFGGIFVARTTSAADLRASGGSQYEGGMLIVPATEQVKNLYAAAPQVLVNANSSKDTVAAGAVVDVEGSTADDLIVAGGNVNVRGAVGGSARIAGGTVVVDSKVTDDLVVAGGNVTVSPTASIGGDLIVAGGTVVVSGPVAHNVRVVGGVLVLNGKVGGDVSAKLSGGLQLGPLANVLGSVSYTAPQAALRDSAASVAGAMNFMPRAAESGGRWFVLFLLAVAIKILAEILAAYVLYFTFRPKFEQLVLATGTGFWKNAGYGFLLAIAVPVASVVLLLTVIGYYIAFIAMLGYAVFILASWLTAGAWFGSWVLSKMKRHQVELGYGTIALGVACATVLAAVPFVGWLFGAILLLAGFGAVARNIRSA
jgi:hypothetical protein